MRSENYLYLGEVETLKMRDNESNVIVGAKAQGKSGFARKVIDTCYNPATQRILVVTQTDPPAYSDMQRINSLQKLATWKGNGMVKFYSDGDPFAMMRGLVQLAQRGVLKNGLIVFEDCTNYIDPNPDRSVKNFLVNHRMYNLDLLYTTHAVKFVPPFFWKMINSVTVFKTLDTFTNEKDLERRQIPNATAVYEAWRKVMQHGKIPGFIQYHLTVKTGL